MEKSEEVIAREKAAVDAMKNAKANMDSALKRIETLEYALSQARSRIGTFKDYVPSRAHVYDGRKTLHTEMDEAIAAVTKALGQ